MHTSGIAHLSPSVSRSCLLRPCRSIAFAEHDSRSRRAYMRRHTCMNMLRVKRVSLFVISDMALMISSSVGSTTFAHCILITGPRMGAKALFATAEMTSMITCVCKKQTRHRSIREAEGE